MRNFYISEGNFIGGQEAQAFGTTQQMVKASAAITKGKLVKMSGNWQIATADGIGKCVGVAFDDYATGDQAVFVTEGFVKLDVLGGDTIAAGDDVMPAAGGTCAKWTTGKQVIGYAVCASANGAVYVKLAL